jgi:hypothetical protein
MVIGTGNQPGPAGRAIIIALGGTIIGAPAIAEIGDVKLI